MRSILIAALIIGCAACADMGADRHEIRASGFIYDPKAQPIVVDRGAFVYDADASALRGSSFILKP